MLKQGRKYNHRNDDEKRVKGGLDRGWSLTASAFIENEPIDIGKEGNGGATNNGNHNDKPNSSRIHSTVVKESRRHVMEGKKGKKGNEEIGQRKNIT